MEILNIFLKRLVNKEFFQFFMFLLGLIDDLDQTKLKIKSRRDALLAIKNRLSAALDRELASALTEVIFRLDQERDIAYSGFVLWLQGLAKHPDLAISKEANVVLKYLKSHGKGIIKLNLPSETAVLLDIISDFKTKPALIQAATVLNAQSFLTQIETKNNEFIVVYKQRVVETGTANTTEESFVSIKKEAVEAYDSYVRLLLGRYETGLEDKTDISVVIKCIEQTNALVEKFKLLTLPAKKEEETPKTTPTTPTL